MYLLWKSVATRAIKQRIVNITASIPLLICPNAYKYGCATEFADCRCKKTTKKPLPMKRIGTLGNFKRVFTATTSDYTTLRSSENSEEALRGSTDVIN